MAETDYVLSENKCLECGGDIYAKAKNDGTARKKNYCSDKCIARAHWKREGRNIGTRTMLEIQRESIAKNTHTCEQCGDQYLNERRHPVCGIRFCSRQCNDIYRKNKSIIRKELEDGDKCTIHYHSCVDCGNQIPGYTKGHRKDPRCSDCEAISNEAKRLAYLSYARDIDIRRFNERHKDHKGYKCKECGDTFYPKYGEMRSVFCSHSCAKRNHGRTGKAKRRARKRGILSETIDPIAVLTRDKWRCKACGVSTPRSKRGTYDGNAPEMDHIIPLASGGKHLLNNVQCLCRSCNGKKAVGSLHDQLLLIG